MRKTFIVATLCLMVVQVDPVICQVGDWENPEIFERNQTQPHATLMPFESVKQALENKRKSSPWHLTLNGTWKFLWSEVPEKTPKNFYEKGYNTKDWDNIKVPSNWQMEGYGYPKFSNVGHPFPDQPPQVPEKFNPVGSYLRTFTLPDNWKDHQVFLHFEGVHSASFATSTQVALITKPEKWSAEYPNLYTLTFELMDTDGHVTEILSSRVGFREVEVKNQAIYINGMPVKFNGVNSHMQHPETGHMVDLETMRKDLTLMKQFNINCVRTCHYPPNVEYIELADELGMYIVDETGDEAHGYEYISYLPEWRAQYLDRMRKLVYRNRNHPSVVIWSAGNESGLGDNICAIMKEGKKIDPSRPAWMYGGNSDSDPKTNPNTFQLKESETITLNLDHKVSGVGGTAILVRNKYRVLPEEYEFTFRLRSFIMEEQSPIELGKQLMVF